ncbi:GDSL esterase/lipase CPRD49 [Capsicum galapagoense]
MIGPSRPLFALFGSSIVELSSTYNGWGATLTFLYARKADIFLRGYGGWNSRKALEIYEKVFPKDAEIHPSLSSYVPLDEYVENMRKIVLHIKDLSEKTRLIMLSAPAVNEEQIVKTYGVNLGRTNERSKIYAEAGIKLGEELGVPTIDFFEALDGMHLTAKGSDILFKKIAKIIKEAEWEPSLDWNKMPTEFADIGTDAHLENLIKGTEDNIIGITKPKSQEINLATK